MDTLVQILLYSLPTGFIGSVVGWFFKGRQRKNSFLAELQGSIDLLATKNRQLMERLLEVKQQNFELIEQNNKLIANQEVLKVKVEELKSENNELYTMLEKLGQKPIRATRRKKDETTT